MKFSEAWLREWVNPACTSDQLLAKLSMSGLEVEGFDVIDGGFTGVVAALVESVAAHPNAGKLRVCQVFDGVQRVQVVCGAANVRAGLTAPFARVGATLNNGEVAIQVAQLRGVDSFGMLCSAAELGLPDGSEGILELEPGIAPGTPLDELAAIRDRSVAIDLTPNRGDCLSMRGIAREVGALFDAPVRTPAIVPVPPSLTDVVPVRLDAQEACPRYLGRVLRGVDLSRPSPLWLRERLRRAGMRSIDPAVDVTNYVMLELGQPLHAFDLAQIDTEIIVRMATAGEALRLLDGRDITLRDDTLVIADRSGALALAGIMGGERSAIPAGTARVDVFLESAFFAPRAILGRPRAYGLHTEASQRFERGVDFALPELALERATQMLLAIAGGAAGPIVRAQSEAHLPQRARVRLRAARLTQLVGCDIPATTVANCLQRLELNAEPVHDDAGAGMAWQVHAPSHRFDIEMEEDLIEEVCRIFGYDNIPSATLTAPLNLRAAPATETPRARLRDTLVGMGFQEAITYTFIDPRMQDAFDPLIAPVALDNPLSSEMGVLRTSLMPGLLKAAQHNHNRQQLRLRLFEIGRCFVPGQGAGQGLQQVWRIGGVLTGSRHPESWAHGKDDVDFFDLKGVVETLLGDYRRAPPWQVETGQRAGLHPGQTACLRADGAVVGWFGRLHPALHQDNGLVGSVLLFELDLDALSRRELATYTAFSAYPAVRRDLALLVDAAVPAADLEACVRRSVGERLVQFTLFDVYAGEGIDSTKKSVGLSLTLQDRTRTLEEAVVQRIMADVVGALGSEFAARQR